MSPTPHAWWAAQEQHAAIFAEVSHLDTDQSYRQKANTSHLRLYRNQDNIGQLLNTIYKTAGNASNDSKVTFNVVMSVTDTVVNKIAKQKPKPTFLTIRGDRELWKKAQNLDQFCQGLAHTTKVYEEGQKVFRDGCIFGTGFLKIYRDGSKIVCERVFPDEIQVDDDEAVYGSPRTLYQRRLVDRSVALAKWGTDDVKRRALTECKLPEKYTAKARQGGDLVLIVEAWHLASGKRTKDGKHTIAVQNCTLFTEDYDKDYFPFVPFRWKDGIIGFWGIGLAEELQGIQREINRLLETIRKTYKLVTVPRVFMKYEGKAPTAQLNNEVGAIIKGEAPTFYTPPGLPAEFYMHLERLYTRAYEIAGISALSATAKKPDGLNSGKSLREYSDIESERFVTVGQAWEAFYMEAYRQMIELAKDIRDFSVTAPSKKFIERIKWSDIQLADDQFVMQVFPTSMLAKTPEGKLAEVQEMIGAGLINREWAIRLLDFPDLDSYNSYVNAAFDDIQDQIDRCLDGKELSPPEPYQNLQLGLQMFQSAYLRAKQESVPEERLELMRQWMDQAAGMLQRSVQMQQAMATPTAGPVSPVPPGTVPGAGGGMPV